jgi:hypothetical protein
MGRWVWATSTVEKEGVIAVNLDLATSIIPYKEGSAVNFAGGKRDVLIVEESPNALLVAKLAGKAAP